MDYRFHHVRALMEGMKEGRKETEAAAAGFVFLTEPR